MYLVKYKIKRNDYNFSGYVLDKIGEHFTDYRNTNKYRNYYKIRIFCNFGEI